MDVEISLSIGYVRAIELVNLRFRS